MSHHLKFVPGFSLLVIGILYACQPNPVVPMLPHDHIALVAGESITTSADITVAADSVQVSICPPNADCFAQDNASVHLQLKKGSASKSVRMFAFIPNYTRKHGAVTDSLAVDLGGQTYKVILRDGGYKKGVENNTSPEAIIQVSRL